MWAQQERFERDILAFAEVARAAGYGGVEISHATPEEPFAALMSSPDVAIPSIHAPAPLVFDGNGTRNTALNLASTDEDERQRAINFTTRSIDHAADRGARFVVVHLGGIGPRMFEAELRLRRLYDAGARESPEVERLRAECVERRRAQIESYLAQARRTLEDLVAYASARGVAIGLENRLHYHEIPQAAEAAELLAPYPGETAGYWHDVGHAEVQARLGLADRRPWLELNAGRCIGAHLHDVDGLADHRAPGNGTVEWEHIASVLPADALRVFEIDQRQPEDSLAAAIAFLRQRGVV